MKNQNFIKEEENNELIEQKIELFEVEELEARFELNKSWLDTPE